MSSEPAISTRRWRTCSAARLTASPATVVERLAPVERSYGVKRVSVPRTVTRSAGRRSSSAAIWAKTVRAPLTDLGRADENDGVAVCLHAHDRAGDGVRSRGEQSHGEPATCSCRLVRSPADRLGHSLDIADQVGVERFAPGPQLLSRRAEVHAPDLQRVEPGAPGQLVDLQTPRSTAGAWRRKPGRSRQERCSYRRRQRPRGRQSTGTVLVRRRRP